MLYMGVDLGGTGIKAGVVSENGEILSKGSTPTMKERPYQDIIRDIAALCEKVAGQANVTMDEIAAIGVGVPGICDAKTGIIPFCTNLGWHDVPFIAEMHKYLPNRVIVDNDATVAGYAESIAGVSRGTQSSVFITLGTGVGGGVVLGGELYGGARGIAGELGHFTLYQDGAPCPCGKRGCLEHYAATTALVRRAQEATGETQLNGRVIFDRAQRGNEVMLGVLSAWIDDIAAGVTGLVHIFNPEMVLIGGGVSAQEELLMKPLRQRVLSGVMPRFAEGLSVERATLGNDAGMIGAARFFMQHS